MRPSQALSLHREEIRAAVARSRTRNPRVFGSVLRGDDVEGSDLDLLVDPLPGTTLLDMAGLQLELEEMLGLPVDVLTPGDLPRRVRERVIAEAQPL
ncbi:MAG: nucleotidyltransferase family protein [Betaproteobacteria bacterium]|nr:nucleotidyltransferase family protein [Betaproteobacteria bacterium]